MKLFVIYLCTLSFCVFAIKGKVNFIHDLKVKIFKILESFNVNHFYLADFF